MKHLWLLCVLHSALCVLGSDASDIQNAGHSTKYNMTRSYISDSWQSSAFNNRCFLDTAVAGEWDYFHTKNVPDSDGYHWLLIQLPHAIRVKSVTVYGRKTFPSRAESTEILLSDRLPAALNASNGSCYATLAGSLSSLTQCGVTKREETATHRVACRYSDCTKMTKYILLRKNVQNETDKYMNFQALEVEEGTQRVQFFRCQTLGGRLFNCKLNDLRILRGGDRVFMKLCPPCQLTSKDDAACHVAAQSGSVTQLKVNGNPNITLVTQFIFDSKTQGGNFTCSFNCYYGETITATESIGYPAKKPSSVTILPLNTTNIGSRKFLAAGSDFLFSFTTEAAYPSPAHTCKLVQAAENTDDEVASGELIAPTRERAQRDSISSSSHAVSLISEYRLNMNEDKIGKFIQCVSTVPGTTFKAVVPAFLPEVVGPSQPEFRLPPDLDWKDGSSVSVTVDSSKDNPVPTSHSCYLETQGSNKSLHAIQVARKNSVFELKVSRSWGNSASLVCLVNQSGLIETWARHQLPGVLYQARLSGPIQLQDLKIRAHSTVEFWLIFSDVGNPPAVQHCSIGSRGLSPFAASSNICSSNFSAAVSDNGLEIICQVVQKDNSGGIFFSQTVLSPRLNVLYPVSESYFATQRPVVREGDPLNVSFVSLGGNPPPSHFCWLMTAQGRREVVLLSSSGTGQQFESSFSVKSTRRLNGGSVTCRVSQEGLEDLAESFHQNVSVLFPSVVNLTGSRISGHSVIVRINVTDGNPLPNVNCSLLSDSGIRHSVATSVSTTFSVLEHSANQILRPRSVSITCSVNQDWFIHNDFIFMELMGEENSAYQNKNHQSTGGDKAFQSVRLIAMLAVVLAGCASLPVTAYIWRRTGSATRRSHQRQREPACLKTQRPTQLPLVSVTVGRDPNTAYYYEETSSPQNQPVASSATDHNRRSDSEEQKAASGQVEFYINSCQYEAL